MAKQDDFVKTALRIPRALHSQIQSAAEASGRSMNAEMIDRLQAQPGDAALSAMLKHVRSNEDQLLDATRKQRDMLWSIIDRTEEILNKTETILERNITGDQEVFSTRSNIFSLIDLIKAIKSYR